MGRAFPKFQMVFVDPKTHSLHQKGLCYEYEEYSSGRSPFNVIFPRYRNIFQTQEWEEGTFQKYRKYSQE